MVDVAGDHVRNYPDLTIVAAGLQTSRALTMMKPLLAALIVLASADLAVAEPLDGPAIQKLIGGKHVYLSTPYGLEFPLYYRNGGSVGGDASGFSMASMLVPKENGKWWVYEDRLCQKWPTWYKGKTICFTVDQTGPSTIKWKRDDGMKGTARIAD